MTLEKELLSSDSIMTRRFTTDVAAGYIDGYYNLLQRHSYIDYPTLVEYELTAA